MAETFWADCGNQTRVASRAEMTIRTFNSDPHVAANADIAADRAQQRTSDQEVARQARDEGGVVAQRNEPDVRFELHDRRLVCDGKQCKPDRGGDQYGPD